MLGMLEALGIVHGREFKSDDAFLGPVRPEAVSKENWIQTKPGMGFFIYLRLYGPLESWFDKTWLPSDPELVK